VTPFLAQGSYGLAAAWEVPVMAAFSTVRTSWPCFRAGVDVAAAVERSWAVPSLVRRPEIFCRVFRAAAALADVVRGPDRGVAAEPAQVTGLVVAEFERSRLGRCCSPPMCMAVLDR